MKTKDFMKGVCLEFFDRSKVLDDAELNELYESAVKNKDMTEFNKALEDINYYNLHGYFIDDFIKRDDILKRWHDCGVNHLLIHVNIREDNRNKGHICQQKLCSLKPDNTEEYYLNSLYEKCHEYGITPAIKLMSDASLTYDLVNNNKDDFFKEYKEIINYLLSCDPKKYIDFITIANETHLVRQYANLRDEWRSVIDYIHENFKNVKVSASQFCSDIISGQYDIADYLDIVGVNRYPRDKNWPDCPSTEEMLPAAYNDEDIYNIQEFCKNHHKNFIITECGVSHWSGQCREPEQGNSMINFYDKGRDYIMQANYNEAALISSWNLDYCIGHVLICGYDYDPIFIFNYNDPLKNSIVDNYYGFKAIKSVWGRADTVKVLTKWNHNSRGMPHKQYVINNADLAIRPFNFDDEKCYFKLLTLYLPDLNEDNTGFGQFEACFDVYDCSEFGAIDGDETWQLFFKAGTSRLDFYGDNGITVKVEGENKRCIVTCVREEYSKDIRNSYFDSEGLVHHDINKLLCHRYKYDLYVKMNHNIFYRTFFVKKFIYSSTADYEIYNMTSCVALEDLNLAKNKFYVSSNNDEIIYESSIIQDDYRYTKLFNLDLSFFRNFYLNYSGIFEMTANFAFDYKDLPNVKAQYIKFMINATNSNSERNEKTSVYNLAVSLISSKNYDDNIIYNCNEDGMVEFYYRNAAPSKLTLFRKDNDKTLRIFTLDPENIASSNIDVKNLLVLKEN